MIKSIRLGILFSLILPLTQLVSQDELPNILLIIADDLGVDRLRGYHADGLLANTPTLDSLRAEGITFTNAFAASKCTPSRAAIMSGKFGVKTGVLGTPGNLDFVHTSLFQAMEQGTNGDYADALIGKWHLNAPANADAPGQFGIDHFTGFLGPAPESYTDWTRTVNGSSSNSTDYATSSFTDDALDWIADQTTPWFLWLAHAAPHSPYHVPPAGTFTITNTTGSNNRYVAMIENLDYEIGRLLANIPAEEAANTLIVFVGDNGAPNNVLQTYPAGQGKSTLYQGGVRVPFIISGQGVERSGEREDALVHLVDLHATLLEVAGIELPGGLFNSLSFRHLLDASTGDDRDYNYTEIDEGDNTGFAIRNQRYKIIDFDSGEQEMYDLQLDSLEENNLLNSPLPAELTNIKADLEAEAEVTRLTWSCRDHILNGDETGIDCGTTDCGNCVSSIDELSDGSSIRVFPNPARGHFWVDTESALLTNISLYDLSGRLILQHSGIENRRAKIELPQGLPAGQFQLSVTTDAGSVSLPLSIW